MYLNQRDITYHDCDKEVENVPSTRPEIDEIVDPLKQDLQDEHVEGEEVEHLQDRLYVCVHLRGGR